MLEYGEFGSMTGVFVRREDTQREKMPCGDIDRGKTSSDTKADIGVTSHRRNTKDCRGNQEPEAQPGPADTLNLDF